MITTKLLNNQAYFLFNMEIYKIIMENSAQNKDLQENKDQHPKATDEIQLDIETVTPDTEKDGLPNDQKNNKKVENEAESKSDDSSERAADNESATEQYDGGGPEEEIKSEEGTEKDNGAPDIETVSP